MGVRTAFCELRVLCQLHAPGDQKTRRPRDQETSRQEDQEARRPGDKEPGEETRKNVEYDTADFDPNVLAHRKPYLRHDLNVVCSPG